MAHWDTSGLLKLFLAEADSSAFEAHAAFLRREGESALPAGEADLLYQDLMTDIGSGDIVETPLTPALEAEYAKVLRRCLLHSPPAFVRTNDALHLASARLAGEQDFVSAELRQRAAAVHLGFNVLP